MPQLYIERTLLVVVPSRRFLTACESSSLTWKKACHVWDALCPRCSRVLVSTVAS
ncbi:hypothetical protein MY11210_009648, partial [Beauveria gryllotalpidicola]